MAWTCASAGLYAASFPPLSVAPLAWVALAPFVLAVAGARIGVAAGLGLLWGVGMGLGTAWWLPGTLARYFGASPIESALGFAAIAVFFAGTYIAAFAAWLAWASTRRALAPVVVAAGWTACEFARANLLVANPWALAAYSQWEWGVLLQSADLAGPFGLAWLLAWAGALLASAAEGIRRCARDAVGFARFAREASAFAAAIVALTGYGEWRLSQRFDDGEAVRVAIVQGGVERAYRGEGKHRDADLERYLALTRAAAEQQPQLVVWPEGALDFALLDSLGPASLRVFALGRELGVDLLAGAPRARWTPEGTRYTNALELLHEGRPAGSYEKLELMPFSETRPLRGFVPIGPDRYTAGSRVEILRPRGLAAGTAICSEATLPAHVRRLVAAGADVLVNPSNDAWLGAESASRQQLAASVFRAVESRRWLVRATPTGHSAFIDPHGRVAARGAFGRADVVQGSVRPATVLSPYQRLGDVLAWVSVAVVVLATLRRLSFARPARGKPLEEIHS